MSHPVPERSMFVIDAQRTSQQLGVTSAGACGNIAYRLLGLAAWCATTAMVVVCVLMLLVSQSLRDCAGRALPEAIQSPVNLLATPLSALEAMAHGKEVGTTSFFNPPERLVGDTIRSKHGTKVWTCPWPE